MPTWTFTSTVGNRKKMTKYFRVKKDTFMWEEGAILKSEGDGYVAVDEVWNHVDLKTEYISDHIVENEGNSEWFERVYPVNLLSKTIYKGKAEAKELLSKEYKG